MAKKPTEAAKALLAEAAQDYAAHQGKDPMQRADEKTAGVMGIMAAQRGAARRWSTPPESRNGGE